MSYIEGFVLAVPVANKDAFIAHANLGDAVFIDHGAARVVECWQVDVSRGENTDFFGAVDAKDGEAVVFSWIEWPSKSIRQDMVTRMDEIMRTDDRFNPERNPMPFDGARMIHGSFTPILERGKATPGAYVQGFIVPVPKANKDAYRTMAEQVWGMFEEYGALRTVEAWQDEVPEGKQTDFFRAVKAGPDEAVVISMMEWPSRAVCDAAAAKMQTDDRMQPPADADMPFDGRRMIWGGFAPVVELTR